jgi:hypothetical protein
LLSERRILCLQFFPRNRPGAVEGLRGKWLRAGDGPPPTSRAVLSGLLTDRVPTTAGATQPKPPAGTEPQPSAHSRKKVGRASGGK